MARFTVRLDDETAARLASLARRLGRSRASLAAEAVACFVADAEWQCAEIAAGLAEADAGYFASAAEIERVLERYGPAAPPP